MLKFFYFFQHIVLIMYSIRKCFQLNFHKMYVMAAYDMGCHKYQKGFIACVVGAVFVCYLFPHLSSEVAMGLKVEEQFFYHTLRFL